MTKCPTTPASDDICLTQAQTLDQLIKLLPRGRAWRTDSDAPVRRAVLNAIASIYAYFEERLCALRLEFFCATQSETKAIWMEQYGLPDACDPYPDLCAKVAAYGGATCDYYQEIAANAGWSIACVDIDCGPLTGRARAGCAKAGRGWQQSELHIRVNLAESTAYTGGARSQAKAGCLLSGQKLACAPDFSALECILIRVVHAHVKIVYSTN